MGTALRCWALGAISIGFCCQGWAAPPEKAVPADKKTNDEKRSPALTAALRNIELAQLRLRQYEQAEYPLARKRLDHEITLAEAELKVQQRRIKEVGESSVFKYSEAFGVTLDEAKLAALRAELKLDELRDERITLQNGHSDRCRLLSLELEGAIDQAAAQQRADQPTPLITPGGSSPAAGQRNK